MMLLLDVYYGTGFLLATRQVALLEEGSHVDLRYSVLGLTFLTTNLPLG